jgi:hypothetical protein
MEWAHLVHGSDMVTLEHGVPDENCIMAGLPRVSHMPLRLITDLAIHFQAEE